MMKTLKNPKTLFASAAAITAVAATAAGCYLLMPSGYISIDINPSIEIRTNRLNDVTSITGVNDDGNKLLEGYRLRDRDLDDVVEDLVDRMVLQGYLSKENQANLLVTTEEGTVKPETLNQVNAKIADYVEYRSVSANVIGQSVSLDDNLKARAKEQKISAGKLSVIERMLANDPTLRPEELRDTKVGDLLAYAKERNITLDLLEDRLDDLDDHYDNSRYENVVDLLEDQLDDHDDDLDDRDDDIDDRDDDLDDRDDDLDDRDDDIDDRDDDMDDRDDDLDDRDDDVFVAATTAAPAPVSTPTPAYDDYDDDDNDDDGDDDSDDDDGDDDNGDDDNGDDDNGDDDNGDDDNGDDDDGDDD